MLQSSVVTFALMTTEAFSQNVGKLFSEFKLVTDRLLFIYAVATEIMLVSYPLSQIAFS